MLFPFGYGLSYTRFEYSSLKLSADNIKDTDTLTLTYKIRNAGDRDGAEVSQIYVSDCESTIFRPKKELRAFSKVFLKAGEEKEITVELSKRAFAYYNTAIADWHVESGDFEILVGASVEDIRLKARVNVTSSQPEVTVPDFRSSAPCYYGADINVIPDSAFRAVSGRDIPPAYADLSERITLTNSIGDASHTKWGGRIISLIDAAASKIADPDDPNSGMVKSMALEIPIRDFVSMSQGVFTEKMAEGLLTVLNGEGTAAGMAKIVAGLVPALKKLPELIKSI